MPRSKTFARSIHSGALYCNSCWITLLVWSHILFVSTLFFRSVQVVGPINSTGIVIDKVGEISRNMKMQAHGVIFVVVSTTSANATDGCLVEILYGAACWIRSNLFATAVGDRIVEVAIRSRMTS